VCPQIAARTAVGVLVVGDEFAPVDGLVVRDPVAQVVEAFHPIGDAPAPLGLQMRERVP
jgi:hypothetical protein